MIIRSQFKPSWWLKNPHLQTLWAAKVRRQKLTQHSEEELILPDGDFVELVWSKDKSKPLICIFHGLEGSIDSQYAIGLFNSLIKNGFSVCFMHFRGCGHKPNKHLGSYHSGKTDDIQYLLEYVTKQGFNLQGTIGISLGGNALLKYLGTKPTVQPKKNIAISAPILLNRCSDRLDKGFSKLYCGYLLSSLKIKTQYKEALFKQSKIPYPDVSNIKSFWAFDNAVTAPIHGFKSVDDYYKKSSARQFLKHIKAQTLIIHALDDPFMHEDVVPKNSELSASVTLELSKNGGHVGFVYGAMPMLGKYWLDERVNDFLSCNKS